MPKCSTLEHRFKRALIFFLTFFIITEAKAGESPFGFIYTTDLMPKGKAEFEQRINEQHGQAHGSYDYLYMRSEVEYGITDAFQAALYLNYDYTKAKNNDVNGKTTAEMIPADHNPDESYSAWRYRSTAVEFIYRLMSPYKDPFGLAIYFEPYYGKEVREYEGRIILQKNFLDDRLVLGANIVTEYEKERSPGAFGAVEGDDDYGASWAKRVKLDTYLGASYRFASNWSAGLEYRLHNDYDGYRISRSNHIQLAHFAGPTIHYGGKKYFWTLAALFQIQGKGLTPEEKAFTSDGKIYGDHANLEALRFTIGIPF